MLVFPVSPAIFSMMLKRRQWMVGLFFLLLLGRKKSGTELLPTCNQLNSFQHFFWQGLSVCWVNQQIKLLNWKHLTGPYGFTSFLWWAYENLLVSCFKIHNLSVFAKSFPKTNWFRTHPKLAIHVVELWSWAMNYETSLAAGFGIHLLFHQPPSWKFVHKHSVHLCTLQWPAELLPCLALGTYLQPCPFCYGEHFPHWCSVSTFLPSSRVGSRGSLLHLSCPNLLWRDALDDFLGKHVCIYMYAWYLYLDAHQASKGLLIDIVFQRIVILAWVLMSYHQALTNSMLNSFAWQLYVAQQAYIIQ